MGLRTKIFIILATLMVVFELGVFKLLAQNIQKNFDTIERQKVFEGTERVHNALKRLLISFQAQQADWARWDDTYRFVQDGNINYQNSNLEINSLVTVGINFSFYINNNNEIVASRGVDLENQKLIPLREEFIKLVQPPSILVSKMKPLDSKVGFIELSDGPYVVASMPIIKSDKTGLPAGILVWGYKIDETVLQDLRDVTHYNFEMTVMPPGKSLYPFVGDFSPSLPVVEEVSEEMIKSYLLINDINNKPAFLLTLPLDRPIRAQASEAIRKMNFLLFVSMGIFLVTIFFLLHRYIFSRFLNMEAALHSIIQHPHTNDLLPVEGNDEVAHLAHMMNATLKAKGIAEKEQRVANENLRESHIQLALAQEQLLQSHKLESLGKLAGGIAHDFNNILAGILGYASLLENKFKKTDPNTAKKLAIIARSAERGGELTRNLLGFARRGQYEKKVISLNRSVEEAIDLLVRAVDKMVAIEINLEPHLWPIEGDSTQMLQVLMNLGVNAQDAMPHGGTLIFQSRNIEVASDDELCRKNVKPGKYVRIRVSDTGVGIPREIQDKIFDPFFTTKTVGKGSGLGLSMVYGILQNHGGMVLVSSEPGQGAVFELYFPARPDLIENMALQVAPETNAVRGGLEGKMILVVDDEDVVRGMVCEVLEEAGLKTMAASSGEEALHIMEAKANTVHLILLDVIMPIKDGISTYGDIHSKYPEMGVLFASGYSESEPIANLRKNGNVGFIHKPFKKEDLLNQIENLIFKKNKV